MNEKNYKKRLDSQKRLISKQVEEIGSLKLEIEKLKLIIEEKDEMIKSVGSLREELIKNNDDIKKYKKEYKALIDELRKMKEVMNKTVYKGKWLLVKFLIK